MAKPVKSSTAPEQSIEGSAIRTCVIGGMGFLGKHLLIPLMQTGRRVTAVGRRARTEADVPRGVSYVQADYRNESDAAELLSRHDEVIELAYATVPATAAADPISDIQANLPGTVRLLEAAARSSLRRVVIVSSGGTVYGEAGECAVNEDSPTNPISQYGITKLSAEKYALMYHHTRGVPAIIVRPSTAYGEGQAPFRGQGFVATAIGRIMRRQPISIFGRRPLTRDYIHAADVASGVIAALTKGQVGECYNIGTGIPRTNLDVIAALEPLANSHGFDVMVRHEEGRPFDVGYNVLDSSRLLAASGWKAAIGLDEGLERTWNWCQRYLAAEELGGRPEGSCIW